jgi:UDPglucose--hexose-1-phosphate uridylyltransferase
MDETTQAGAEAPPPTRLVWNPLAGEHVAFSPGRMRRREGSSDCPFCADLTNGRVPPGTRTWIRPNDFPALRPPAGECYILIYSPDHDRTFADLAPEEALEVVGLWQDVYAQLAPRYPYVMSWETSGAVIGQTQRHPHGQTYGVSVPPPVLARELAQVERALAAGEGCVFCRLLAEEAQGPRVVVAGEHWLAFVPPFARYPYEVHVYPCRHQSAVGGLERGGAAARELAALLPRLVRVYNRLFTAPMPYMLAVKQLADERYHLHVELLPVGRAPGKLKLAASSEMVWGLWLNDAFPEASAAALRELYAAVE